MIKKVFYLVIFAIIISLFALLFGRFAGKIKNGIYYSHCKEPILYKIGNIDNRFGITKNELESYLEESASIWGDAYGKELFKYDEKADLTINLSYDRRQALNEKIDNLDLDLQEKKNELDPKIEEYKRRSESFTLRLNNFNAEVQKWNNQGGAPPNEYDKLIQEQESLKNEAEELNALAQELGQSTEEYNDYVKELNQTVNVYGQEIQGRPEEGLYERSGNKESITIYLHTSEIEFLHTLTHEFGHALGLNHVDDINSIMYSKSNEVITPSDDDLKELEEICKDKLLTEVIANHYVKVFESISSIIKSKFN